MAENKFIERLQGKGTEKSVVEIKNTATPTMFTNMPAGDSNDFNTYSDHRGNATVVANGTMNWKVDSLQTLTPANIVNGNGEDFTTSMATSGAGLWINAEYTFPSTGDPNHPVAMVFNPQTKWVLKVCGDNLLSPTSNTIDFTVLITFGSNNIISKTFTVAEQANKFSKEFVIDFAESNTNVIKAQGLSSMKLQLLCGTADASANIYGGMTVLTCLQRKVEAVAISSTFANVEEVLRDGILPSDYFNNQAYIAQVTDGDTAYAVFQRDGDEMLFVGWNQPIPDQTGNSGKFLMTNGSLMSWEQLTISDVEGLQDDLDDLQDQITTNKGTMDNHIANTSNPHQVTKTQVGLGNVDNTSDLDKPISTAAQTALDGKVDKNADITGATKCKITYDNKGLVTAGADLAESDIPSLHLSKISDVTASASEVNVLDGITASTSELNILDGITATTAELNYTDGVTSNIQTQLDGKQATISDLATIRSGASAGATAVQPSVLATVATSGSYTDLSNKPTIPAAQVNSDWNANSGVAQILNKPTIPTVNNPTITITQGGVTKGSFTLNQSSGDTIALDAGGGGSIDAIDNLTITKNSDDEIQAIATVNANTATGATNPVYDWVGTLAEYNAQDIENQHPDWMCYITDDVSGGTSVYTKTEVDNNFVGKGHEVIEFQAPTAANNYTWYRKYADGWVEQGGLATIPSRTDAGGSSTTVTFPISMSDTNYTGQISYQNSGSYFASCTLSFANRQTTRVNLEFYMTGSGTTAAFLVGWQVSGMAA